MGAVKSDYIKLAPPRSFIYADDFKNVGALAKLLIFLDSHPKYLAKFHEWRDHFVALNEHAFFASTPSVHYCRICEALHFNKDKKAEKTYNDLEMQWDKKTACQSPSKADISKWTGL